MPSYQPCNRSLGSRCSFEQHLHSAAHNCEYEERDRIFDSQRALQRSPLSGPSIWTLQSTIEKFWVSRPLEQDSQKPQSVSLLAWDKFSPIQANTLGPADNHSYNILAPCDNEQSASSTVSRKTLASLKYSSAHKILTVRTRAMARSRQILHSRPNATINPSTRPARSRDGEVSYDSVISTCL